MAVTQSDIDNLTAALASGARSVTLGGQTITYNTTASLIQARDALRKELAAQTRLSRRNRQTYAYQNGRGYD
jgi:hypothetical protein